MGSSASTTLKVLCLPTVLAATPMLLVAVGLRPVDDDQLSMAQFWSDLAGVAIPYKFFFAFVGTGKLIGNAAMWGYLPKWLRLGVVIPALCGSYMHSHDVPAGSTSMTIPPIVFACMAASTWFLDDSEDSGKTKKT
eukprot:CAMPEP_0183709902 /NCGR_PEP_ID=MMETSP0737-20130205/5847_1 /TAXON_ID=385413 /ORGANISM="Thalassiosira miniscula, Strain CCMP1093" /LENGTH=135 /DNA_ID=CAMNT_0025938119 /DNA_START=48 /DNA_END=455 /DNA_ORIENTATION=-